MAPQAAGHGPRPADHARPDHRTWGQGAGGCVAPWVERNNDMIESGHAWTHHNDAPFSWSMPGIEPLHGNPCDMRQRYKKH
eukprot:13370236-Alexandrium_andersonii.AAC.1